MFLSCLVKNNPELIKSAVSLHQAGKIPANSYVLDLDTIRKNAELMQKEASRFNLRVFAMTKQIGRNPEMIKTLMDVGIDAAVCVDMADARAVYQSGMKVGHLGHLVQVPRADLYEAIRMEPLYWTIYDMQTAHAISERMPEGKVQNILLRVIGNADLFYKGHEGGFSPEECLEAAAAVDKLKGLRFSGITSFPTQLFDHERQEVLHTHNYTTLIELKEKLRQKGYEHIEFNAPGTTSSHLFEEMSQKGVTQVEPGHGLTGTTPIHAVKEMEEKPAMIYVSEISHFYQERGYCYGGGMYIDPVFPDYNVKACVGNNPGEALEQLVSCDMPAPAAIDYYGILARDERVKKWDSVVFGFRAQAFVTRAYIVPVSGIRTGTPVVKGVFDANGKRVAW